MKKKIDINCDMGESYYDKKIGNDSKIMPFITSSNIACGFHGGDPNTIRKTIELAIEYDVKIGAHPSYFDLKGFGRRKIMGDFTNSSAYNLLGIIIIISLLISYRSLILL